MSLFVFIYITLSILSGALAFSLLLFIQRKFKSRILLNFILFTFFLNITLMASGIEYYYTNLGITGYNKIIYLFSEISVDFILFFLPLFINSFFIVSFRKLVNIFFLFFSLLFIYLDISYIFFNIDYWNYLFAIITVVCIVYCVSIGFIYYRKLNNILSKKLALSILILLSLFIPGFIYDMFIAYADNIYISYLFLLIWNSATIYYIFYLFNLQSGAGNLGIDYIKCYSLTPREIEILQLVLKGKTSKEISELTFISIPTVKTHLTNIFKKTKTTNRYELITMMLSKESI